MLWSLFCSVSRNGHIFFAQFGIRSKSLPEEYGSHWDFGARKPHQPGGGKARGWRGSVAETPHKIWLKLSKSTLLAFWKNHGQDSRHIHCPVWIHRHLHIKTQWSPVHENFGSPYQCTVPPILLPIPVDWHILWVETTNQMIYHKDMWSRSIIVACQWSNHDMKGDVRTCKTRWCSSCFCSRHLPIANAKERMAND